MLVIHDTNQVVHIPTKRGNEVYTQWNINIFALKSR